MNVKDITKHIWKRSWLSALLLTGMLLMLVLALGIPKLTTHVTGAHAANVSWPTTYLGDNARGNYNSSETVINSSTAPNLQLLWQRIQCCESPITSQPLVANNLLYWGLWAGHEHASNPTKGGDKWTQFLSITKQANCDPEKVGIADTATVATVTINGLPTSVVFSGGGNAQFYALNALTGKVIWKKILGDTNHFIWSSPAVYNGSVYIGLAPITNCPMIQGQLLQLDATTGHVQNTFNVVPTGCLGGGVWGTPAIDEQTGMIYFGTGVAGTCSQAEPYTNSLVELNASDLSYVASWQVPTNKNLSEFRGTPTLFPATINGTPYQMIAMLNKNGTYYAFDRTNLAAGPLWHDQLGAAKLQGSYRWFTTPPSAWDGTYLYAASNSTTINGQSCTAGLRAINPADGSYVWELCLNTGLALSPVMAVPGLVALGVGPTLYVVDATDGNILFNYANNRPGAIFQDSATISNGILYAADDHGDLYAFTPSSSLEAK